MGFGTLVFHFTCPVILCFGHFNLFSILRSDLDKPYQNCFFCFSGGMGRKCGVGDGEVGMGMGCGGE